MQHIRTGALPGRHMKRGATLRALDRLDNCRVNDVWGAIKNPHAFLRSSEAFVRLKPACVQPTGVNGPSNEHQVSDI